jgi:dTDP-4-amino-4,6-dideoxygalactose transaminase
MLTLQSRHRLDIRLRDFAYALSACAWAPDAERLSSQLESSWSPAGLGLASRSVRSGFHLLLEALALPAGSEVLVSAVTHPDMIRILEAHTLVAVPVDLHFATLAPKLEVAARLVTPRTKAMLVAHLFGGRLEMGPVNAFARRHQLLVWEDCAQAFTSPSDTGDPSADASMYSFGALKTCTALGGALLKINDRALVERMRRMQREWCRQSRRAYATQALKFFAFFVATRPLAYRVLAWAFGRDFDRRVNSSVRAFRPGELLPQLEVQPSAPLLTTLGFRLRKFDGARLRRRAAAGEWLAARLPADAKNPGYAARPRTHWLFPVVSSQADQLISACRRAGIDAARGASSVSVVSEPEGRPESEPREARAMMASLVFVPAYPELPRRSLARLVTAFASRPALDARIHVAPHGLRQA